MGSAGGERMSAAMRLLFNFAPAAERCDDAAEAAARKREAAAAGAALPEGDDPRARFIRQCAADDGNAGICGCIADRMLEKMGPLEFELMVDMQAARGRGEDALASLARERGMTVDEAREALAMMSGRIAGVMMSIDPMSCMESVE
jgi:hypothetical protein